LSPHGLCLLWRPELIWLHVMSDAIIALAYFSIPFAISVFVMKRPDVQFNWVFWAFAIFIMACGMTHVMSIWTLWVPDYAFEGLIKAITAAASIMTAVMLWPLLPKVLALPSPAQLIAAHEALKREVQDRRQAEDMLRQAQRLDAVGHLTGGVAYDFNNLLTVIMGNCELIANKPGLDAEVVNRVRVIQDAAGKASAFTKSMMAFGRKLPLQECAFDLNLVITELEPLLRGGIGKGIHVDIELHPQVGCIRSDPAQIEQVMLNLVLNACDAMPGGGPITIRTLPVDIASALAGIPDAVPPGRYAALIVGDTGCGIDVSDLQRVFEPFYTTKDEFSGRGMGLATVYGIVSQNRGFIQVASQPGSGTTFTIYLPSYLPSGTQQLHAPTPESNGRSGGHETVLLVEDDRRIIDLLAEYLHGEGYKVLTAMDGEAGLAMYLQHADGISLVISDIAMPRMDGQNLVRRIRKLSPEMPIILMTGAPGEHGVDAKDAALPARILMKPFSPRILARAVRDELDRTAVRHHRPE
jgi:signal transduction histidine kinase/CheY-like chemotaxis protein